MTISGPNLEPNSEPIREPWGRHQRMVHKMG
jgi:hypothetical protein